MNLNKLKVHFQSAPFHILFVTYDGAGFLADRQPGKLK